MIKKKAKMMQLTNACGHTQCLMHDYGNIGCMSSIPKTIKWMPSNMVIAIFRLNSYFVELMESKMNVPMPKPADNLNNIFRNASVPSFANVSMIGASYEWLMLQSVLTPCLLSVCRAYWPPRLSVFAMVPKVP